MQPTRLSAAISCELSNVRGHRTVSVVRREAAAAVVRENGGDVVLLDGEDLATRVAEATDGAEIRLGIDAIGGSAAGRLAESLGESATLVNYGSLSGDPCAIRGGALGTAT